MFSLTLFSKNILKKRNSLANRLYKTIVSSSANLHHDLDESGYRAVPHYNEKSALFTKFNSVFPKLISPDLDFKAIFESETAKSALLFNLNARHMHIDIVKLNHDYAKMANLEQTIQDLDKQKEKISNQVNNLVKNSKLAKKELHETSGFKRLIREGNQLKEQINEINEKLAPLQEIVKIACLRLPNSLHACTLLHDTHHEHYKQPEVLFSLNDKLIKRCPVDHWKETFQKKEERSFVESSSTCFEGVNLKYYTGAYAYLERALTDYIYSKIEVINGKNTTNETGHVFEHMKSISMFKSAVIEGCGQLFNNPRGSLNIVEFGSTNIDLFHLTGASSLNALVLNFIRTKIKSKYLPWSVFTNGKNYSPQKGQINQFDFLTLCAKNSELLMSDLNDKNLIQKSKNYIENIKKELNENSHSLFSSPNETKIDNILVDYLKLFVYVFKEFNVPIRYRLLHANELESNESLKIVVESYMPSEHKYVIVSKKNKK